MADSSQHHHETSSRAGLVSPFWKFGSFVLGFGLVLAIWGNSGPATASAGEQDGERTEQVLSIGGFDAVDGEAAFVIVDGDGERVGVLPLGAGLESEENRLLID